MNEIVLEKIHCPHNKDESYSLVVYVNSEDVTEFQLNKQNKMT